MLERADFQQRVASFSLPFEGRCQSDAAPGTIMFILDLYLALVVNSSGACQICLVVCPLKRGQSGLVSKHCEARRERMTPPR